MHIVVSWVKRLDGDSSNLLAGYTVYPKQPMEQSVKKVQYIMDVEINHVVRKAVKAVFSVKFPKKLPKFSSSLTGLGLAYFCMLQART